MRSMSATVCTGTAYVGAIYSTQHLTVFTAQIARSGNMDSEMKDSYPGSKFSAKQWFCLNAGMKIQKLKKQTYPKKKGQR